MKLFIYTITLMLHHVTLGITTEVLCKSPRETCRCSTEQGTYTSYCPKALSDISMMVSQDRRVWVECSNNITWDSSNLPLITVGNSLWVHFDKCSFPDTNFLAVMNKLGVSDTKILRVTNSLYFKNSALTSDYFSGLHLEKLYLESSPIGAIAENAFKSLNNLSVLVLHDNGIRLVPQLFEGLSLLKELGISKNGLTDLPAGIFKHLINLEKLSLFTNTLTSLSGDTFNNLRNLQSVEFLNNQLEQLPEEIFHSSEKLATVVLARNRLRSLPKNLFSKNRELHLIDLRVNEDLTLLPEGLFSNLTKLEVVYLDNCNLTQLPSDLFEGCVSLRNVTVHQNRLERLPEGIFKEQTKLYKLDLGFNKLVDVPDGVFSSLSRLKILNLESNMLESISETLFVKLFDLEMINLKNNRIHYVHQQAFLAMPELKIALLANNSIRFEDNSLDCLSFSSNAKLEVVDLSYNNITDIGTNWISKIYLRKLNLRYNHITDVQLQSLIAISGNLKMDLSHNRIATIDFGSMPEGSHPHKNAGTTAVLLNNNPIHCDCLIYDFVGYLEHFDPRIPNLVTVRADNLSCAAPDHLIGLPLKQLTTKSLTCSLEQMQVKDTCPEKCNCQVRMWDQAFVVNCTNGNLARLPKITLPELNVTNQTIVYFQGNLLTEGPKPNMGYENVTKLFLSSNNINEITWVPPKLEVLSLDNNNISHINSEVISKMNVSTLKNISLGGNPWNCDCKLMDLSKFLVLQLSNKHIDSDQIKCNNGKLVVRMSTNDLCPTSTTLVLSTSITLILIALVAAVLAALYYRHQHEIKVWLFAHDMLLCWVTEEEVDKHKSYDAFISYSHKDEDFVLNELVSVLEQGPQPYKLCLHIRNWVAGEFIQKQISRSVEDSRRTIVLLSPNFLQSVWGKMEFRAAHTQTLSEGRARVIVILYGDINVDTDLDDELKAYIKTNTYVKWGDPWFWDKLKYALPHSKLRKKGRKDQNIMIALNDKLEINSAISPSNGSADPLPG